MVERSVAADESAPQETFKLRLLSFPVHSPDHASSSGCSTPPFPRKASVPFKWEKEPGKPIPCTALIPFSKPISRELKLIPPPRLSWPVDQKLATTVKTHSPTTVLDGPEPPERGLLGPMVMSNREKNGQNQKKSGTGTGRRLFGSWSWGRTSRRSGKMGKRDQAADIGGSFVFPSSACSFDDLRECYSEFGVESESVDEKLEVSKIKKNKSFLSFTLVMPWKGSKLKKNEATTTST